MFRKACAVVVFNSPFELFLLSRSVCFQAGLAPWDSNNLLCPQTVRPSDTALVKPSFSHTQCQKQKDGLGEENGYGNQIGKQIMGYERRKNGPQLERRCPRLGQLVPTWTVWSNLHLARSTLVPRNEAAWRLRPKRQCCGKPVGPDQSPKLSC